MKTFDLIALGWFTVIDLVTMLAFGFDKWRAGRSIQRISEFKLALLAALGGWPGGLAGMILFHHKTAKWTFKFKFALALIPFMAEVWLWWHWSSINIYGWRMMSWHMAHCGRFMTFHNGVGAFALRDANN